jgi:hypothetical protein
MPITTLWHGRFVGAAVSEQRVTFLSDLRQNAHKMRREGTVEIRLFYERTSDHDMMVERVYIPADAPQSQLLELILYVWGSIPEIDEVQFTMALDPGSAVLVTRASLLMYVNRYRHLYGG